ncbi:hypothetical protein SK128_016434 [Halocaridina rubra]|uniref:Uncharacterized protein n=1 Tax=Halocaridina rubra TaxID=373956 RepID=A0AAN8XCU1_HALRR
MRRHTWTRDRCTMEAERRVVEYNLTNQRTSIPKTLHQYQISSAALVAVQQCAHTDAWHNFTNSINLADTWNTEWLLSVTHQHYNHFSYPYKYCCYGHLVSWHNVVSAFLRLGYRPVWQVGGAGDVPHYSSCDVTHPVLTIFSITA